MDHTIKSKIITYLRQNGAACASDIAKGITHNRITIGKYLQILEAQKLIVSKKVASAIFWELSESKSRILIADDEQHIVDLIRLSLGEGYDVHVAYNGEDAVEITKQTLPNVIILDIMMPKKDGFEVCDELKNNLLTQKIPIVFLSAKGGVEDKIRAMELGAEDYIVKPFDPLELEARIASIIRRGDALNTKNSITGLPNKIFSNEMKLSWEGNATWFETHVQVENFESFIQKNGHKKGYEVIKILGRLLLEEVEGSNDYLGHMDDTTFVIFSNKKHSLSAIKNSFEDMQPYFDEEIVLTLKVNEKKH